MVNLAQIGRGVNDMFGKKIELFLVNGTFDGTVLAELSNWNGKAIKVLRDDKDIDREDLKDIGIYFLFCGDESDGVYIGESENVSLRLKQHKQDYNTGKEEYYWSTALAFTGRDLNKAKIRFLENELIMQANDAKRYTVLTKSSYSNTKMKESEKAEMMEFIENIKVLVNTMGYRVFTKNEVEKTSKEENEVYYITRNRTNAKMIITSEGFVLLAGSVIRDGVASSYEGHMPSDFKKRQSKIEDGYVDSNFMTTKDIVFGSPSGASNFVLGACSNGKNEWKDKNGICLADKII